jgi:hypothetical protein
MEKNVDKLESEWEHLYTQFKYLSGGSVICVMHKQTKQFAYFDVQLNRFLSKQEALIYRVDATGIHVARS